YQALRRMEQRCRKDLRQLYDHREFEVHDEQLPAMRDDLFDTDTWSRLGLSRTQLATAATVGGALAGGAIDVAALGHSFMLGSLVGGAVGFGSSWFGWNHLED